jgi:serine/threonine protein kinase/Tol biopolymer transport system component
LDVSSYCRSLKSVSLREEVEYGKSAEARAERPTRNIEMRSDQPFPDPGFRLSQSSQAVRARWDRITQILSAAWEISPESRLNYIAESCGSDAPLRNEVERLLDELENMSGFLEHPAALPDASLKVEPGSPLGPYLLNEKIGEGGMGIVYEATDTRLGRRVALKLLRGNSLGGASGRQRFFQEARMMATLNHPSVVTIYDVGSSGDLDFIAMELVDGKSLDRLLRESRLPLAKALTYARQVGSALSLAHSLGIVHRDLKPGNIIIGKDDVAKVLDFGLAKWARAAGVSGASASSSPGVTSSGVSDITMAGDIFGTIAYMSPEQAGGQAVDERSDVFSFGAVLYEMVSGSKAFGQPTQNEVLEAIARGQPAGLRHASPPVPRRIEEIIFSCLKKDPRERPRIDAVVSALDSASRGSRRTVRWVAATALLLAAVASAAVWIRKEQRVPQPPTFLARPITDYAGDEIGTSFSPDGTQIAFAWRKETESHFGVYTRALDGGEPRPLTAGEGHHPAWAPSGREIAFLRGTGDIFLVHPEGGAARKVVSTEASEWILWPALSWSPDSQWIAYSSDDAGTGSKAIYAVAPGTGVIHKLTSPNPGEKHIQPAFSLDGKLLAFTVDRDGVSTIGVVRLDAGMIPDGGVQEIRPPQLASRVCNNPVWRPSGGELMFLVSDGALRWLWSVEIDAARGKRSSPRLLGNLGEGVHLLAAPRTGNRLAFTRHVSNENIHLLDLTQGNSGTSQPIVASAYRESWPRYSPDCRRIAFESDRGGFPEIWLAGSDGSNAFALTGFHGPVTGSPAWSPDSRQIAFDTRASGEPQVYTVRAEKGAQPQRITTGNANFLPAWSADGRYVYFVSNRTGGSTIWRVSADGGPAVQISRNFGFAPQASADGRFLYFFAARSEHAPIHRIDLATLEERSVIEDVMDRSISVTGRGLYYLRRRSDDTTVTLRLFEPSVNRDSTVLSLSTRIDGGLDVRKDDRAALAVSNDFAAADLMLIEDLP